MRQVRRRYSCIICTIGYLDYPPKFVFCAACCFTAQSLNNLASLLRAQGDYAAARPLFERALTIREQALGPLHPHTATSLNNLADLETEGRHLSTAARRLWQGERDGAALAAGLDAQDAALVARVLELIGDGEGREPSET